MRRLTPCAAFMILALTTGIARADSLPPGALPVSGTFTTNNQPGQATGFPIQFPSPTGVVFVLTDIAFGSAVGVFEIFAPDDLINPRFQFYRTSTGPVSGVAYGFQTGLVFSDAPLVRTTGADGTVRVSFSGYFRN